MYISDKDMSLKQSQGHQSYNDEVDSEQGHFHAKLTILALLVSEKKQRYSLFFCSFVVVFFQMKKYVSYLQRPRTKIKHGVYSWST